MKSLVCSPVFPQMCTYALAEGHRMVVAQLVLRIDLAARRKADEEGVRCMVAVEEVDCNRLEEGVHRMVAEDVDCSRLEEGTLCLLSVGFLLHNYSRLLTTRRGLTVASIWLLICHLVSRCDYSLMEIRGQKVERKIGRENLLK
jgi:hypothetical protein